MSTIFMVISVLQNYKMHTTRLFFGIIKSSKHGLLLAYNFDISQVSLQVSSDDDPYQIWMCFGESAKAEIPMYFVVTFCTICGFVVVSSK